MRWVDLLIRRKRRPIEMPAARPSVRVSAGMDYLLAQAGGTGSAPVTPAVDAADTNSQDRTATEPDNGAAVTPVSIDVLVAAAEQAQSRQQWAPAETLWRAIRIAFPQLWYAYANEAVALCGLERHDDARRLLSEAATRFPLEPAIPPALARLEMNVGQWQAAERHWRAALAFEVRPWWIYTELSRALEEQGRFAEAEAVLLDGQGEDPNEPSLFMNYARLAWKREDWSGAVARWAEANRRFPRSEPRSNALYQALMRLAEWDPDAADRAHTELGLALADFSAPGDKRALLLRFESLGGTGPEGGCEFGGVQREHGAEPLGLFRWATVTPASLIACLEGRFEGIGEADTTTVFLNGELWEIGDTAYHTSMHSFVSAKEVPHDRMVMLAGNRMRYLKQKLIADLEHPEKIFVLKVGGRHLEASEIEALGRALRSYGPGELLCVCPADSMHPEHSVVAAAPGVFIGYIDFSGRLGVEQRHASWETLCSKVLRISALPPAG